MHGPYCVNLSNLALPTASTPQTLIQLATGSSRPVALIGARLSARGSGLASNQAVFSIRRMSTATSVLTSFTPLLFNPVDPAANAAGGAALTGVNSGSAPTEGTPGDILVTWNPNVLSGWQEIPIPEGRIYMNVSTFLAMRIEANAAAGVSVDAQLIFLEMP